MPNDYVRALPRQPEDNFTDVVIRVSDETMAATWADLERPMLDSPDFLHLCEMRDEGSEWGFDDGEMRLLAGAFGTATAYLPLGPYEYIRWVDRWDEKRCGGQYVAEFIANRIAFDPPLYELTDEQLDELAARIPDAKERHARAREEEEARYRETKRRKNPRPESKQAKIEQVLAGASIGEVWNAVANSFEGEELNEIGTNLYMHVDHLRELTAAVEAA